MQSVCQSEIPGDMQEARALPGVQPLAGPWLRVDEAYAGQMQLRRELIARRRSDVHVMPEEAAAACAEVLEEALALLPGSGFEVGGGSVLCPDGETVKLDSDPPLCVLGRMVQEDICIMQRRGGEHVLTAAVLCFPASWQLSEKVGRPLTAIHGPVTSYDGSVAKRVQRMFDGVRAGRPLWRYNRLYYEDPALFQPRSEMAPRRTGHGEKTSAFQRAERQCILRLPHTGACVFSIHTYVVDSQRR